MKKLIILVSLLVALPVGASFDNNLYYGINGSSEVSELQEFLTTEGVYSGPITGNFYSLTLKGVKAFQTANDISPVSGYFGPISRAKANGILASQIATDEAGAEFESTSTEPATADDIVAMLSEQIKLLISQIAELQKAQLSLAQQSQTLQNIQKAQETQIDTLGQISENTTPAPAPEVVVKPEPVKKITFGYIGPCQNNKIGSDFEVYYWENGERVNSDYVTVSSESSSHFDGYYGCTDGEVVDTVGTQRGNPLTCATKRSSRDNKPSAYFMFFPSTNISDEKIGENITISVTTKGVSATTNVWVTK